MRTSIIIIIPITAGPITTSIPAPVLLPEGVEVLMIS